MNIEKYLKENYGKVDKTLKEMSDETGYTEGSLKTLACRHGFKRNTIYPLLPNEEWASMGDSELSRYEISNCGRVRQSDSKSLLKSSPHHQSGYLQIRLVNDDNKKVTCLVHSLVAEYYLQRPKEGVFQIDHIDRDRENSHVSNLRFVTPSENVDNQPKRKKVVYLTEGEVRDICEKLCLGMSISQIVGTNSTYTKSRVEKIKQRIRWTKISKDYNFK